MTHYDNIYSKLNQPFSLDFIYQGQILKQLFLQSLFSVKVFKCIEMILESHYINQYLNVISRRELLSS